MCHWAGKFLNQFWFGMADSGGFLVHSCAISLGFDQVKPGQEPSVSHPLTHPYPPSSNRYGFPYLSEMRPLKTYEFWLIGIFKMVTFLIYCQVFNVYFLFFCIRPLFV